MGISDKLEHAAEELKNKGQDALHRATGKDDDASSAGDAADASSASGAADASSAGGETGPADNHPDAIGGNQIAGSVGGSTHITGGRTGTDDLHGEDDQHK